MFQIPNQNNPVFVQSNSSDRKGNVSYTRNISFSQDGYIEVSKRIRSIVDDTTMTDFNFSTGGGVYKTVYYSSALYALGTKNVYYANATDYTVFAKETTASFPTLDAGGDTDAVEFNNDLYIVATSSLVKFDGAWSTVSGFSSAETLCLFVNLNQLAIAEGDEISTINTSDTVQHTCVLPPDYVVTKMAWNNNKLAIATRNTEGGKAAVFEWDGLSNAANAMYEVDANIIYSIVPYKNGWAIVTSDGKLLFFNGGFVELDSFPVYFLEEQWQYATSTSNSGRRVASNAMVSDGDKIFIGISSRVDAVFERNDPRYYQKFPAGVWEYNPVNGLHHKYSIDSSLSLRSNTVTTANINTTTDVVTVAGVTVPETGTPVFYYNGVVPTADTDSATPLTQGTGYYTIKTSGTTFKLATSLSNALAGTAIDLTGTGNNNQFFVFMPTDQFGSSRNTVTSLALAKFNDIENMPASRMRTLIVGGVAYDSTDTGHSYIGSVAEKQENRGSIEFSWMPSSGIQDFWSDVVNKFKPLLKDEDKIIVKARTTENTLTDYMSVNSEALTTEQWATSTSFTTTRDISDVKTHFDLGKPVEVEIMRGRGSGYVVQVSDIEYSGGTYTVTIDEAVAGVTAGDKLKPVFTNYEKFATITKNSDNNSEGWGLTKIERTAKKIQVKLELRGFDTRIEESTVSNQTKIPYTYGT